MCKGKILIGTPICQEPIILQSFLHSIKRLQLPDYEVYYHFIDDNHEPHSQDILNAFRQESKNALIERFSEDSDGPYQNHKWSKEKIWKIACYKDHIIERARQEAFDYLFLIDSDLLLHPITVGHLIEADKEIVSEIFWTKWSETAIEQPQVWLTDFYNQHEKELGETLSKAEAYIRTLAFFSMLRNPGIYEIGGLGACTLISKSAIEKGISFQQIKNISFWGEDRHFCIRASALGIGLFVDTHYPAYHIYRDTEVPGGIAFLEATADTAE